jgi:hypothetical protein
MEMVRWWKNAYTIQTELHPSDAVGRASQRRGYTSTATEM